MQISEFVWPASVCQRENCNPPPQWRLHDPTGSYCAACSGFPPATTTFTEADKAGSGQISVFYRFVRISWDQISSAGHYFVVKPISNVNEKNGNHNCYCCHCCRCCCCGQQKHNSRAIITACIWAPECARYRGGLLCVPNKWPPDASRQRRQLACSRDWPIAGEQRSLQSIFVCGQLGHCLKMNEDNTD